MTGARLKPISMTTAPVTTGGRTAWMTRAPRARMAAPHRKRTAPTTSSAPVRVAASPPWVWMTAATPMNDRLLPR